MSTGQTHVLVVNPVQERLARRDVWTNGGVDCGAIPIVAVQWCICKERNCDLMNNGITRKCFALFGV